MPLSTEPLKYEFDPRFDAYYLEDSYVLGLDESDSSRLVFSLLLVLTPKHALYAAPLPGEQHCYRNGALVFDGVTGINWHERHFKAINGPNGEVDYGNVDSFLIGPGEQYCLGCEWGRVALTARYAAITVP